MGHKWEQYLEKVVALEEHLSAERAKLHFLSGSAHPQLLSEMTHLGFELSASKWEITKCESSHLRTAPFMDPIFLFTSRLKKISMASPKIGVPPVLFQFFPQVSPAPPRQFMDNSKTGSSFSSQSLNQKASPVPPRRPLSPLLLAASQVSPWQLQVS